MSEPREQRTLAHPVELEGTGLHSGEAIRLTIRPREEGGVRFVRSDLPGTPAIPVDPDHLGRRRRRTTLAVDGAEVQTVEHLLAALSGLWIDHATVEIDGPEVPGADGSARSFVSLLEEAGVRRLDRPVEPLRSPEALAASSGPAQVAYFPAPESHGLHLVYEVHYPDTPIGLQRVETTLEPEAFARDVAPARTFCLESEVDALREAGLGKGASTENTLVVGEDGPIDNELRFEDEYARHKLLDLVGDLAILGRPLAGRIVGYRSGHDLNAELTLKILRASTRAVPPGEALGRAVDLPALDEVRVLEDRAVGSRRVGAGTRILAGHFPDAPVLPGVYELEAMAEAASALAGGGVRLTNLRKVRFKQRVEPGQRLEVEATPTDDEGTYRVRATVEGERTAEAILSFTGEAGS